MTIDYLLHEAAIGYSLFEVTHQADSVALLQKEVNSSIEDVSRFRKLVKLVSFAPFPGAAQALANANDISEGICSEYLQSFLEINLPKSSKKHKATLGVTDKALANSIKNSFPNIECETAELSLLAGELLRGVRTHMAKLVPDIQAGDIERGALGLAHAYSRGRVKFSVQKNDNHIMQAIATLDGLDKATNTFSMRMREWYSWTFPELLRIVNDNATYAKVALFIGDKKRLSDNDLHDLAAQVGDDEEVAQTIIDTAKISMGRDISENDMETVMGFAERVVSLTAYRRALHAYLVSKMSIVAPNLAALIGEVVGARLISHAGSLTNLCKYPASTVQILGAEKALFRALKTKGNTPKYGLLYHSSFIGKAGAKNKGRISRFLANKCSIASRIDNFSHEPSQTFGEALRRQVEERLEFYSTGTPPTKNVDAMKSAMDSLLANVNVADPTADADVEMVDVAPRAVQKQEKKRQDRGESEDVDDKKKRKRKEEKDDGASEKKSKKEKKEKKEKKSKKEKKEKKKIASDSD